ncbi:methyltransferase [Novosphingobium sp. PC22D]|uniref:O-methyltransferase n=1 Tax=Novosphingobium sp. PC22D TaxID=1962403 RepID=UPI000BF2209A|nr:O-methyltransferase [Novosphingobium sp. PC22D]PEQ11812.1 methyltransferase [Novosphingobium sp. PC22D]
MASSDDWAAVDDWLAGQHLGKDDALDAALAANAAAGLPHIDVSATHGRLLQLLALSLGARRVLEIGTLGGFSTICLARGLAEDGRVVTLEIDPKHARIAAENIARAGQAGKVEIRQGPALETLEAMIAAGEAPFDLFFIDADKENNANYLKAALSLSRKGTVIVVDNVVRDGGVIDPDNHEPMIEGTRRAHAFVRDEPRLLSTAVQTVGSKGWDGFICAVVA